MYSVNQCYEDGLYFSDYVSFCEDAQARITPPGTAEAPPGFARILASDVTFTYPGADEPSLSEVSVEIGRGEVIALVGENGSGKTTLAKILAGLYRPQAGTVRWDDVSIADVHGEPLRERIAVIAQDHGNWPLTVRDNIIMGRLLDDSLLASAAAVVGRRRGDRGARPAATTRCSPASSRTARNCPAASGSASPPRAASTAPPRC